MDVDVCVVGAGLAGLVAAQEVERAGRTAVVLEARDRVGGRLLNHPLDDADTGDGAVVEVGGQWVGPGQSAVLALLAELGLETFHTHAHGRHLVLWRGRRRRYRGAIPRLSPRVLLDVTVAQARLERLSRRIDPERPWTSPDARALDARTFETWISSGARTRDGRELLRIVCQAVWACEPADVSLLHVLWYARCAGGLDALTAVRGGAQQDRVVGGSQRIALALAEGLHGDVVLGAPVRGVAQDAGGVRVRADGREVRARACVMAIPPGLTGALDLDPAPPPDRVQLVRRVPQGTVTKCNVVYPTPFWRAEGLSGQAISDVGPTRIVFDNSPPDGRCGVLLGFLEGRWARELGRTDPEHRRAAVVAGLVRLFGEQARHPVDYVERLWAQERWTEGCYGAYLPPGAWTAHEDALRRPHGRVAWAGAETATAWAGYMDGAVRSGRRAAREALGWLFDPAEAAVPVTADPPASPGEPTGARGTP